MRGKILAVVLFLLLLFIERILPLGEIFRDLTWGVSRYFVSLRGYVDSVSSCVVGSKGARKISPPVFSIVELRDGEVLVKGKGERGDIVIGTGGTFVGRVEESVDGWVLVKTPLSDGFRMRVSVAGSDVEIEGELHGGSPPILTVPEDIDVSGWEVFISRSEEMGLYLRDKGMGRIGRVSGRFGGGWVVDYRLPPGSVVIVGR